MHSAKKKCIITSTHRCFDLKSVSPSVFAGPLAVRPLLHLLRGGWYHLLHTGLPQPNRGLLSPSSWKEPKCPSVAPEASLPHREGTTSALSSYQSSDFQRTCLYFSVIEQAEIRTTLSPLYQAISNNSGPAMNFIRSRVERMSERWIQAGLRMRERSNKTVSSKMRVKVTSYLHQR